MASGQDLIGLHTATNPIPAAGAAHSSPTPPSPSPAPSLDFAVAPSSPPTPPRRSSSHESSPPSAQSSSPSSYSLTSVALLSPQSHHRALHRSAASALSNTTTTTSANGTAYGGGDDYDNNDDTIPLRAAGAGGGDGGRGATRATVPGSTATARFSAFLARLVATKDVSGLAATAAAARYGGGDGGGDDGDGAGLLLTKRGSGNGDDDGDEDGAADADAEAGGGGSGGDAHGTTGYKRKLTAFDLTMIGIGGIIGAGICLITGRAAATTAGPALVISFMIAGSVAALASLCYAEMASLVPVAGSAYTYAYATLGELAAWVIGWDLMLEYLVGAATVAVGWSEYLTNFIHTITGKYLDARFVNATWIWNGHTAQRNMVACPSGSTVPPGDNEADARCAAYGNFMAMGMSAAITLILLVGVKTSTSVNAAFVAIKLVVVLVFIGVGAAYIKPANYHPFVPPSEGWGKYGWSGVFQASMTVFFAYIGFDAVSTASQEARNPRRDVPIGILASLFICTALYIAVTAVLTGVKKYTDIDPSSPFSSALPNLPAVSLLIDVGALSGLASVMLVLMLGQPRILQAMASDGLLPPVFATVSKRTGVPVWGTATTGVLCAVLSGVLPIDVLGHMTSVGTLFGFAVVCAAVPILRYTQPTLPRPFAVPGGAVVGGYVIPIVGCVASVLLMAAGPGGSLVRLVGWMAVGLVVYAGYGWWGSAVGRRKGGGGGGGGGAMTSSLSSLTSAGGDYAGVGVREGGEAGRAGSAGDGGADGGRGRFVAVPTTAQSE
ncbi:amino acid permease-domain-containing protein [Zopfochytrium polystomum]|nr:amino acid permease-domain-containing protein [Zopfochytrium polystomum]